MQYVITGRGARVKHVDLGQGALCGSSATQEAKNRFAKLEVHAECAQLLAEAQATPDPEVTVRLSARVGRWLAAHLSQDAPEVTQALTNGTHSRTGRGCTLHVTAPRSVARALLAHMKEVDAQLRSRERTTAGMGFREEAVAKGIEHITHDLGDA